MKKILFTFALSMLFTVAINAQTTSAEYLKDAKAKFDAGDYSGAIPYFNEAIAADDYNSEAFYLRGMTYLNLGDKHKACENFVSAKELGYKKAEEAIQANCN